MMQSKKLFLFLGLGMLLIFSLAFRITHVQADSTGFNRFGSISEPCGGDTGLRCGESCSVCDASGACNDGLMTFAGCSAGGGYISPITGIRDDTSQSQMTGPAVVMRTTSVGFDTNSSYIQDAIQDNLDALGNTGVTLLRGNGATESIGGGSTGNRGGQTAGGGISTFRAPKFTVSILLTSPSASPSTGGGSSGGGSLVTESSNPTASCGVCGVMVSATSCYDPCDGNMSPTFTISPTSTTTRVGTTASFQSLYDPDGPVGLQSAQDVTSASTWSLDNPAIASLSSPGQCRGLSIGSATVSASYPDPTISVPSASGPQSVVQSAEAFLNVSSASAPDFSLTATPATLAITPGTTGTSRISLVATGGFTGTVSLSQSGLPPGVSLNLPPTLAASSLLHRALASLLPSSIGPGQTATMSLTVPASTLPGSYSIIITGTSGTVTHTLVFPLSITNPATGFSAHSPHYECVNNSCSLMYGSGFNRCQTNADCTIPAHGSCDAASGSCVNRAGSGTTSCASDPACGGASQTHTECQNSTCLIVGGAGPNQCAGGVGSACTSPFACTFAASPSALVIPPASATHLSWSCTGGSGSTSCVIKKGSTTLASGTAGGSVSDSPSVSTRYTMTCTNAGTSTTDTKTVDVSVNGITIQEVGPR